MALTLSQRRALAAFPIGHTALRERKTTGPHPDPVKLTVGKRTTVCTIRLPKGGEFLCGLQLRLPSGYWAESRFTRVGWGKDPDGRDETGLHTWLPKPDGSAASDSFLWPVSGGGPLAFEVEVHGPAGVVTLPTVICKAKRWH